MAIADAMEGIAPAVVKSLRRNGAVHVYECVLEDGARAVVKRIDPLLAGRDPLGAGRFRRELHFAELLHHPSLPRLLARGDDWMAFEYLQSSLCDASVARQHSAPDRVRNLLSQLAAALAFVHARGVVHADIKPGNVMFRGETAVLIDFGIAGFAFDDPLSDLEVAGTPAWMAPEQITGGKPDAATDIWSLSALCLWLLTGSRPFSGEAEAVLEKRRRNAAPEFDLSSVAAQAAPCLTALLQQGLGPRDSRPTSAAILQALAVR